jgi:cysteinyl-tRNA synthetase
MDRVLGLDLEKAAKSADSGAKSAENEEFAREIEEFIAKRAEAKKAKDFAAADSIRQTLKEKGILLEDSAAGTKWRRK